MKRFNGFSLMEMMVVLLITSIIAAASAPMINKKLVQNSASQSSPWTWVGVNGNAAFNLDGTESVMAMIGTSKAPEGVSNTRLYLDTKGGNSALTIKDTNSKPLNIRTYTNSVYITNKTDKQSNATVLGFDAVGGPNSTAIGYLANSNDGATALGDNSKATGISSIAIGSSSTASNTLAVALGNNADATMMYSTAIGSFAKANIGNFSTAVGYNAQALGGYATALGDETKAIDYSTAVGALAKANEASYATAIGCCAYANFPNSTALGYNATAEGSNSVAIGGALAESARSIAIGVSSYVGENSSSSIALGAGATVASNAENSVALGAGATAPCSNVIVLGTANHVVYIPGKLMVDGDSILGMNENSNTYVQLQGGSVAIYPERLESKSAINTTVEAKGSYTKTLQETANPSSEEGDSSDRRLKNVGEVFKGGLAELKKIELFHFTFKADEKKTPHVGVMAQDLKKIFPNAVWEGKDGFLRIRWDEMFFALINAVKELDVKIDLLAQKQKKIDELEKRIDKLEKRLSVIEKKL